MTDHNTVRLPLSRFGQLAPVMRERFTKLASLEENWYKNDSEAVLQSFELPLGQFVQIESPKQFGQIMTS